jgi:hypothetical protein
VQAARALGICFGDGYSDLPFKQRRSTSHEEGWFAAEAYGVGTA